MRDNGAGATRTNAALFQVQFQRTSRAQACESAAETSSTKPSVISRFMKASSSLAFDRCFFGAPRCRCDSCAYLVARRFATKSLRCFLLCSLVHLSSTFLFLLFVVGDGSLFSWASSISISASWRFELSINNLMIDAWWLMIFCLRLDSFALISSLCGWLDVDLLLLSGYADCLRGASTTREDDPAIRQLGLKTIDHKACEMKLILAQDTAKEALSTSIVWWLTLEIYMSG